MTYGIYKGARDASWKCLLDCKVASLPVNPVLLLSYFEIGCRKARPDFLHGTSGVIVRDASGGTVVFFDSTQPRTRQRFTILHELGHYVLGHLGDSPLSRSERDCKPEEEYAADRFAADVLMPACVLWGLGIHTAEDIARVCGVSMHAAKIRAERMAVLYQRNMFLSHPLEREVFQRFKPWIDAQIQKEPAENL